MTTIIEVPQDKLQDIQTKSSALTDQAKAMVIADRTAWDRARDIIVKLIRPALKEVDAAFDPQIEDFHRGHKNALTLKKRYATDFETAENILTAKMKAWEKEDFARQEAERRRIEQEQAEKARLEREERERQEKARLEQEAKARDAALVAQEEERLRQALEAEKRGNIAEADKILNAVLPAPVVVIPTAPPLIIPMAPPPPPPQAPALAQDPNVRRTKRWKYKIINPDFVKRAYMMPNVQEIGKVVRAMGDRAVDVVGGIEVTEDMDYAFVAEK